MANSPHWHDYKLTVILEHEVNPNNDGWTFDYDEIDSRLKDILAKLNNADLNKMCPFNPTSEMIACWILGLLPEFFTGVRISENERSSAEVMKKNIKKEWLDKFMCLKDESK